jgi:subtilisin family serine protease
MGFRAVNHRYSGQGVKIGVIDSGASARMGDLVAEKGFASSDQDENGHGTHVCGIIGARNTGLGVVGGAPNARLYPVKVFPGGHVSDMVEGIEWCIRNGMDVINIGAGTAQRSQVLAGAIRDAYDRGITCVAAAGNEASGLAYPAALPTTITAGAIGRFGAFPEDSAHALRISNTLDWYGGLFAANFSNTGDRVDVCAPGVAILSTVPKGFASWDGTSMACSMVSSLVALILEAYPSLRTGDAQQVEGVRHILHAASVDLGMPARVQGRGLPMAPHALPPVS